VVDQSIVLSIGPLKVSRYALDKHFKQFLDESANKGLPAPGPRQLLDWFTLYLARNVIIARAIEEGYASRPDILALVGSVEEYMLSQPHGPFYRSLVESQPVSEARLHSLYLRTSRVLELTAVRMPIFEAVPFEGPRWQSLPDKGKLRLLRESRRPADLFEGSSTWPYYPLDAAEPELNIAGPDSWIERRDGNEIIILHVGSIRLRELPAFPAAEREFREMVRDFDERKAIKARRSRLLESSTFAFDPSAAEVLCPHLRRLPKGILALAPDTPSTVAEASLASYVDDGKLVRITVGSWISRMNSLFARQAPADLAEVERSVEDMAVMRLDCEEARLRGIDRAPQFVEDRRNFLNAQVLDFFERENLIPSIRIGDEEIADYYRTHSPDFVQVTAARGRLLGFGDGNSALAWIGAGAMADSGRPMETPPPQSEVGFAVSGAHPIPGFPNLTPAILYSPDGTKLGPFPTAQGVVVIVKTSTERSLLPLGRVASGIRAKIVRRLLDQRESALAREWSGQFHVEDRIPYEDYGLPKETRCGFLSVIP
jgi:hypothetical protein